MSSYLLLPTQRQPKRIAHAVGLAAFSIAGLSICGCSQLQQLVPANVAGLANNAAGESTGEVAEKSVPAGASQEARELARSIESAEEYTLEIENDLKAKGNTSDNTAGKLKHVTNRITELAPKADTSRYLKALEKAEVANNFGYWLRDRTTATADFISNVSSASCEQGSKICGEALVKAKKGAYGESMATVDAAIKRTPGLADSEKSRIADLRALLPAVEEKANKMAQTAAKVAQSAHTAQKQSLLAAVEAAQCAVMACDIVFTLVPNHAAATETRKVAAAMAADLDKQMAAKVYSSPWHKQNVGNVLFSGTPVAVKSEQPGQFATEFQAGKPLYAVAYLPGLIGELVGGLKTTAMVGITLSISGNKVASAGAYVTSDDKAHQQGYWTLAIVPQGEKYDNLNQVADLLEDLAKIMPGNHEVTVQIHVADEDNTRGKVEATGKFKLDTTVGMDALGQLSAKFAAKVIAEARMPAAGFSDAGLEKQILAAAKNNEFGEVPLKVVITETAWKYTRNALTGIVIRRSIRGVVGTKEKDGTCNVRHKVFTQQASGAGFAPPSVAPTVDGEYRIDCKNVK